MLKRHIITTGDGSKSIVIPELNEHYHSIHGAIGESRLVYIEAGLIPILKNEISIFEMGYGTGLNALLSYSYAQQSNIKINYFGLEKYPLSAEEVQLLNYSELLSVEEKGIFQAMHNAKSGTKITLAKNFDFCCYHGDIRNFQFSFSYDVCFFDAFAPDIQSELWTYTIFRKIYAHMNSNGILTTYSAKGQVKKNLQEAGFHIEKLPGPPGKREFLRARK